MLPMEAATAGTGWSSYPSAFLGRSLGIVNPKGSSSCCMRGTRVNHRTLSGSRLLRKPVSVSKSLCELQHDFRDSNPNTRPNTDQEVSKLESWRNKLETVDFLIWIEAHLGTIQAIAVGELLQQMGDDDVPLDVSRALEKFSWDMWRSFFNVMVAQMLGRL